jgi:orotidine-5'-phosphate decarboxylase
MTTDDRPLDRLDPAAVADARRRLVVALDYPDARHALAAAQRLSDTVRWVKVGLELFVAAGPAILHELRLAGFDVFLDLKFHDIPNTVAGACASAARSGVGLINVHAGGGVAMMRAARDGAARGAAERGHDPPRLLGVTMLTSLTGEELPGYYDHTRPVADRVVLLAEAAREAGLDGVVCSPREVVPLRAALPADFLLLTPGIRFAGGDAQDQARVATPFDAAKDGADFLVIGRPITGDPDPAAAARRALVDIAAGVAARGRAPGA